LNTYDNGDLIKIRGSFTNRDLTDDEQATFDADGSLPVGVGQDPTTVTFKVKQPNGTVDDYVYGTDVEVVKQVAGSYHITIAAAVDGLWRYRWESTGPGQAATEERFYVRSEFY
jgi:hypothetical protein